MGYTNYWYQKRDFTPTEWAALVHRATAVIAAAKKDGVAVGDSWGIGQPAINDDSLCLNGREPDDYETFRLTRNQRLPHDYEKPRFAKEGAFDCCKTGNRPYDAVVVAILHYAKKIAPDAIDISSDGGDEVFKDAWHIEK
jgi:hypothetical protein